jgi:Questin oxidase-like
MSKRLDEALERLRGTSTEVIGGGDPNHGAMAAEALVFLGRDDVVVNWVDRYRQKLDVMPAATLPVSSNTWREALGHIGRIADWTAFFRVQLDDAPWRTVFADWIGRLLRGAISAGQHGLIRTAHAIRALEEEETSLRVEELGVALAYWAAYYRELPGVPRFSGNLDFEEAIAQVPRVQRGQPGRGMPRELFLKVINSKTEFTASLDRVVEPVSVEHALSSLTEAGARLYLSGARRHPLVLLHTVTGPSALRLLLPHLPTHMHKLALTYVWQAVAAIVAMYADESKGDHDETALPPQSEIIERSIETDDPHAIKFVEACVREFRLNPQPVYLAASHDWATRLHQARNWSDAQRADAGIAVFG